MTNDKTITLTISGMKLDVLKMAIRHCIGCEKYQFSQHIPSIKCLIEMHDALEPICNAK